MDNNTVVVIRFEDDLIYFDCENHAGDREVCLQISAICNLLVCECLRYDIQPVQYKEGRVHLEIQHATESQREVFYAAEDMFKVLADRYPGNLRLV